MAYIPWYDRLKPATLGERFGLNEISTARNTLSPTNSHTAGLSDMFPGTFTSYQDALAGGFQGTMEEWLQQQSIPQIDRPLAEGGRIGSNWSLLTKCNIKKPPGSNHLNTFSKIRMNKKKKQ